MNGKKMAATIFSDGSHEAVPVLTIACSAPLGTARAEGIIRNVNTLEDFRNMDKTAMLKTAGRQARVLS